VSSLVNTRVCYGAHFNRALDSALKNNKKKIQCSSTSFKNVLCYFSCDVFLLKQLKHLFSCKLARYNPEENLWQPDQLYFHYIYIHTDMGSIKSGRKRTV
jgi:hypothetical protein